jgi:hypothetical protein
VFDLIHVSVSPKSENPPPLISALTSSIFLTRLLVLSNPTLVKRELILRKDATDTVATPAVALRIDPLIMAVAKMRSR